MRYGCSPSIHFSDDIDLGHPLNAHILILYDPALTLYSLDSYISIFSFAVTQPLSSFCFDRIQRRICTCSHVCQCLDPSHSMSDLSLLLSPNLSDENIFIHYSIWWVFHNLFFSLILHPFPEHMHFCSMLVSSGWWSWRTKERKRPQSISPLRISQPVEMALYPFSAINFIIAKHLILLFGLSLVPISFRNKTIIQSRLWRALHGLLTTTISWVFIAQFMRLYDIPNDENLRSEDIMIEWPSFHFRVRLIICLDVPIALFHSLVLIRFPFLLPTVMAILWIKYGNGFVRVCSVVNDLLLIVMMGWILNFLLLMTRYLFASGNHSVSWAVQGI